MKKNSYDKSMRLRRNAEFQYVFRRGHSASDSLLVLLVAKSRGPARVGFSVGKKVGNSVARSRVKRWLRESYRLLAPSIRPKLQLVFVARATCSQSCFHDIYDSMQTLLIRNDCLMETK